MLFVDFALIASFGSKLNGIRDGQWLECRSFGRKHIFSKILARHCLARWAVLCLFYCFTTPRHVTPFRLWCDEWQLIQTRWHHHSYEWIVLFVRRGFDSAAAETIKAEIELIHCVAMVFSRRFQHIDVEFPRTGFYLFVSRARPHHRNCVHKSISERWGNAPRNWIFVWMHQ